MEVGRGGSGALHVSALSLSSAYPMYADVRNYPDTVTAHNKGLCSIPWLGSALQPWTVVVEVASGAAHNRRYVTFASGSKSQAKKAASILLSLSGGGRGLGGNSIGKDADAVSTSSSTPIAAYTDGGVGGDGCFSSWKTHHKYSTVPSLTKSPQYTIYQASFAIINKLLLPLSTVPTQ